MEERGQSFLLKIWSSGEEGGVRGVESGVMLSRRKKGLDRIVQGQEYPATGCQEKLLDLGMGKRESWCPCNRVLGGF